MTFEQIKARLRRLNLTHLARLSGVDVRTLRRLRNGYTSSASSATLDKLRPLLRK
jgi:transcriptional regulator with XRE-family HTH domain